MLSGTMYTESEIRMNDGLWLEPPLTTKGSSCMPNAEDVETHPNVTALPSSSMRIKQESLLVGRGDATLGHVKSGDRRCECISVNC